MRIPEIFILDKDLEKKICELIKKSENMIPSGYNESDTRIIYNRAQKVAEKLGKLDSIASVYSFEDKETGIVIEYYPRYKDRTAHLRIYDESQKHLVFKADKKYPLLKDVLHIPGEWEERLRELCKEPKK
ncbi:hypothetical protein FJZ53_01660 [Candidatus Woesearchaeota archaeon]|nr:hypothetical protein [Candidatus Woesearchaeota archaeon]